MFITTATTLNKRKYKTIGQYGPNAQNSFCQKIISSMMA